MKRNLFKTLSLLSIFILICLCFVGCAQVNFVTYQNSDGTINEYVYLTLDDNKLLEEGYNPLEAKITIKNDSNDIANYLLTSYRRKVHDEYEQNKLSLNEYEYFVDGVSVIEQDWKDSEYIIGLQYQNSETYRKYYNLLNNTNSTSSSSSNKKQVKKTFYTKTYYYGTTGYADYSIFKSIYDYYSQAIFNTISPQETTLSYSYAVNTRRFHSNADSVNPDTNGNYIHTWNVSPNEPDRQIYFYTISANRSMWIIVCVLIGLTITIILCIIGMFKYLKTKNINNSNNINDNSTPVV